MEYAKHVDISIHLTRIIKDNMDLKTNKDFYANAFYTIARCELGIVRDVQLGKVKNVKGAKGSTWYSRQYRAMITVVRHTRLGKASAMSTLAESRAKHKEAKNPKNEGGKATANNTPLTYNLRVKCSKRKHSSDAKSDDEDKKEPSDDCRKRLKIVNKKLDMSMKSFGPNAGPNAQNTLEKG